MNNQLKLPTGDPNAVAVVEVPASDYVPTLLRLEQEGRQVSTVELVGLSRYKIQHRPAAKWRAIRLKGVHCT